MVLFWGAMLSSAFCQGKKAEVTVELAADNLALVQRLHEKIVETQGDLAEAGMENYRGTIEKIGVDYEMVAIPGGEFLMGSPDDEAGRREDEGSQRKVEVVPFWMGKFEVTWDQYEPFMHTKAARHKDGSLLYPREDTLDLDAVSMPTTPYTDMASGMGKEGGYPAISMTQHAASKFCQWLSAQTGHYYRLPTDAEWEYACRAGTKTAFHFGTDPAKLDEYAVFDPDQTRTSYEKVGTKKPNPWGLYDMHGNVWEWCLDQYFADAYAGERRTIPATKLYPRVVRGGSWYDIAEDNRSAARVFSEWSWKAQDAQLPPEPLVPHRRILEWLSLGTSPENPRRGDHGRSLEQWWDGGEVAATEIGAVGSRPAETARAAISRSRPTDFYHGGNGEHGGSSREARAK